MARNFASASTQYAVRTTYTPLSAYPYSLSAWFLPNDITNNHTLLTLSNGTGAERVTLRANGGTAGDPLILRNTTGGVDVSANTTTGFSASAWNHAFGIGTSSTSRDVWLNNGGQGSSSTSSAFPTGLNEIKLAAQADTTVRLDGKLAEVAIWNVVLTADERAALAAAVSPLLIRPASLVAYWPLIGRYSPEIELTNGDAVTLTNGPTNADHCRIFYPPRPQRYSFAAAVAGTRSKRIVQGGLTNYGLAPGGLVA